MADIKAGVILAAAYLIPFLILMPPDSTNSPGAIFLWFLYPIVAGILLLVTAIVAWKFFDIDFLPWGLVLLIGAPLLTLLLSPIFSIMWGFYIVPTAVAFLVGATQG